jgi:hypothetical protein
MAGDFSTPEQVINPSKGDWESCMTLNEHWGYGALDRSSLSKPSPAKTTLSRDTVSQPQISFSNP